MPLRPDRTPVYISAVIPASRRAWPLVVCGQEIRSAGRVSARAPPRTPDTLDPTNRARLRVGSRLLSWPPDAGQRHRPATGELGATPADRHSGRRPDGGPEWVDPPRADGDRIATRATGNGRAEGFPRVPRARLVLAVRAVVPAVAAPPQPAHRSHSGHRVEERVSTARAGARRCHDRLGRFTGLAASDVTRRSS
jgi:hypothetical protein